MSTSGCVYPRFAVSYRNCFGGAIFRNQAFFTSATFFLIEGKYLTALYANVVEAGLHTAVRASADTDLEFMGKLYVAHADVKPIMNDVCKSVGIYITVNPCRQ